MSCIENIELGPRNMSVIEIAGMEYAIITGRSTTKPTGVSITTNIINLTLDKAKLLYFESNTPMRDLADQTKKQIP